MFTLELGIFMREHFNGMYRTDTYYITRQMAEMPVQILSPVIFTCIFYWMVGMNSDPVRFLIACLINILLVQVWIILNDIFSSFKIFLLIISFNQIIGCSRLWLHDLLSCSIITYCFGNIGPFAYPINDFWWILSR